MTTFFVASGGDNSDGSTWAKAYNLLETALAAATTYGDVVVIQYNDVSSADKEVSAAKTWAVAANITLVSASNDGASAYTPTPMGTANWLGNSTTSRAITFNGGFTCRIVGITFRRDGNAAAACSLNTTADAQFTFEDCLFWYSYAGNSGGTTTIGSFNNTYTTFRNCTFRSDGAVTVSESYRFGAPIVFIDCAFTAATTSAASAIFYEMNSGGNVTIGFVGCDLSGLPSGEGLFRASTLNPVRAVFDRCKLPAAYVAALAQTAPANLGGTEVQLLGCASGDTHGQIELHNAFGSCVTEATIKVTAGAAGQSWKVVTSANASPRAPFYTPWINLYHSGTSAVTPYLEILRDGSATAYTNDEAWLEILVKDTSGSPVASMYSDRCVINATPANQATGGGVSIWEGENATAWSGKCDSGAAVTPAEAGYISARLGVAVASATVYLDPQIRV